jgi:hypothetical protein
VLTAETVYLPEGEKDVHTLESWNLVASCNPGGSGNSHLYLGWAEYFRNRQIVILPDNDEPGRKHAAAVAAALLGAAVSIRIVELPTLPVKGDITGWRNAGGTFDQFRELVAAAETLNATSLSALQARWGIAGEEPKRRPTRVEAADDWPKLEPIQSELPPVEAFSEDLLPDLFRPGGGDGALSGRRREPAGRHPAQGERYRLGGCAQLLGRRYRAAGIHEVSRHSGGDPSAESNPV